MSYDDEYSDESVCPHCGEDMPEYVQTCRMCGYNDEYSGDGTDYDPIAADEFDYDELAAREFPDHASRDAAASTPGWSFRLMILAIIISFLLSLGLF